MEMTQKTESNMHRINMKIKSIGVSNICFKCVKIKLKTKNAGVK